MTGSEDLAKVSVIIPAYNEAQRIGQVIKDSSLYADEVLVVDDGSTDDTGAIALKHGARVIRLNRSGYLQAMKSGFAHATGDIVVTLDADGEHNPHEIPKIIRPLVNGQADLVLGKRPRIARLSERLINRLARCKVPVSDTGTGFRAMTRELALKLTFPGKCICGTSLLEACGLGARVTEVPISLQVIKKPRKIAWGHLYQFFAVLRLVLKGW
jgi:glycosyltransferase involved in cell wall biosynthesis